MLIFDAIWLGLAVNRLYKPLIGHLMADGFKIIPAAVFYVLYNFGIVYLCVLPNLKSEAGLSKTLICGIVLGAVAYGTYDLTNNATLKDWPYIVSIIDIIWGALLTGITSLVCFYLSKILS
ncbi:MAG: DUF2177 family protein [Myxococcales bacterium]|nr:MAG: DUF2177 family protein [Myxococcales bacterium]